ncbi:MAG: radical SAM protein, partial [Candidatus Riflemargulisbacteria bacterium]
MPVIPCEPDFNFFDGEGGRYIVESNTLSYCKADSEKDIEEFKSKFQDGKCVKPNIQTNGLDGKQITHICLQATHECQLRCDYCFVDNYYSGGMCGRMKFETAKKFIDQYLSGEHVSVGFFGGEPLLNMELIVGVVDYCKQKFKNCSFHVTTNGILLNHKDKFVPDGLTNVEYFDQNGFTMIVSLDGSKDAHDIHRKFAGGKSCFDNVIEGVDSLKGKKVAKVNTLRGTFTSELFDSPITLKDRLEFLNKKMYEGCSANISLEPAVLSENSCISKGLDLSFTGENDEDKLMALYYDAIRWYIKELREGRHPTWFQIDLMTTRILYGIHMFSECGAGLGYMSCSWDGRISACHREGETYIGDLKYGIDEQERSKWSENRIYGRYSCMKCPMRYYCGGGCRECS